MSLEESKSNSIEQQFPKKGEERNNDSFVKIGIVKDLDPLKQPLGGVSKKAPLMPNGPNQILMEDVRKEITSRTEQVRKDIATNKKITDELR